MSTTSLGTSDTDLINYLHWKALMEMRDNDNITKFLVLARDGTTCWGNTYRDAVIKAMAHDFPAAEHA